MKIQVFTLNAFAKTPNGGNPAGVVLDCDKLNDTQMLQIAKKVGFSETAFVQKSNKANFKVRFFTTVDEVDLCGHATIALFYLMLKKKLISQGTYKQETKAGILDIEISKDNEIFMEQNLPKFYKKIDKELIADSLNISKEIINDNIPIQIVSTGLRDILVPIKTLKNLLSIKPDFKKIIKICKKFNVIGYHLFSLETKYYSSAHCRNFAPLYDINEEAATGTSNGALSCYLYKYHLLKKNKVDNLIFEQGYSMKRPSEIKAKLEIKNNKISRITVGGTAKNINLMEIDI